MQDCCNFVFETLLHGEWAYLERENYKYPIPFLIVLILAGSSTEVNFSVITRIELLGFNPNYLKTEQTFRAFIDGGHELELTEEVILATIQLRRTVKIKLPDAIIAATALVQKMTLVSDNDADFLRVPKLKYLNPARFLG